MSRLSSRSSAHLELRVERAAGGALRPRLGYPTRLTPRRTVQALYRQSSLSGSRYRARWRHESRIFVILGKFSGIRSHCTLPPLYPPITHGPNIGVMSGRQCVAGSVAAALRQASRLTGSLGRGPSMGSGRVGSVCVPVAAVCVAVLNRRFRAEAGPLPWGPDPTGGSAAASRRDLNDSAWRLL